jgi:hypothetical protein
MTELTLSEAAATTLPMALPAIVVSTGIAGVIQRIVFFLGAIRSTRSVPTAVSIDSTPEHVEAISAAAYKMFGAHRVVPIEPVRDGAVWIVEGRLAHHGSHSVSHQSKH